MAGWTRSRARSTFRLQYDETPAADFAVTRLAQLHYRLFGSRAYLDLYGRPASVQEAAAHRYIHHAAQNKQAERPAGHHAGAAADRAQTGDHQLQPRHGRTLIKGGSGLGPLPTAVLSIEPDLEMLDVGVIASVTLWMYVRREVEQSTRVRRVTEWLKQTFDGRTHPWFRAEFVHPSDFGEALNPARPTLAAVAGKTV